MEFTHETLESDIQQLSKEVAEKRQQPEYKEVAERELLRQSLQPFIKRPVGQPTQAQTAPDASTAGQSFLPDYLKEMPAEDKLKVGELVDEVFHHGIEKTVKKAVEAGPFVLDAFHDALTDKLYEELKKRKLI